MDVLVHPNRYKKRLFIGFYPVLFVFFIKKTKQSGFIHVVLF